MTDIKKFVTRVDAPVSKKKKHCSPDLKVYEKNGGALGSRCRRQMGPSLIDELYVC